MSANPISLERRGPVALLWLDQPGTDTNTLSSAWIDGLGGALEEVRADAALSAAVLISAKRDAFVAGADLAMIRDLATPAEAADLSRRAHELVGALAALGKPTVAAIHGPALGGGLELALGCSYRLATDGAPTRFALPEVRLGLVPGAGGTQHLPRLIGLPRALQLLLTGRAVYPDRARRWGLVDALVHPAGLLGAALRAADGLAAGRLEGGTQREPLGERLLESTSLSRQLVYRRAADRTRRETRGNYPAPEKILDCVRTGLEEGLDEGLETEARRFAQAVFTPEARALVRLFFLRQAAAKNPFSTPVRDVRRIGVLGAGLMGGGIATASAVHGLDVVVRDRDLTLAGQARKVAWERAERRVNRGAATPFERDAIVERIEPVADDRAFTRVDLLIEAVPEERELKRRVLAEAEAAVPDHAVLATNTSAIPVSELAEACGRPERMLGMHYFSPVDQVPLVELVRGERTADEALAVAWEVVRRQGKTPVLVRDAPGFYTTRVLAVYLNEAMLLVEEGAGVEAVDEAGRDLGFPMGPLAVLDLVGLGTAVQITEVLAPLFADRGLPSSDLADRLAVRGSLGRKSGAGFFRYGAGGRREGVNEAVQDLLGPAGGAPPSRPDREERLLLAFVNEAHRCLEEEIVASPDDGDLAAVLGLGFPPFLGGPFRYVETRTAPKVVREMDRLATRFGDRFTPCESLRRRAAAAEPQEAAP